MVPQISALNFTAPDKYSLVNPEEEECVIMYKYIKISYCYREHEAVLVLMPIVITS